MSPIPNYRENFFQHPTLTKITGDPTYASLAKLKRECKSNFKIRLQRPRQRIPRTPWPSEHSHSLRRHRTRNSFHPSIPSYLIHHRRNSRGNQRRPPSLRRQIDCLQRLQHHRADHCPKINTALDNDILADLIDDSTGLLIWIIPEIMGELYDTYGTVAPQSLTAAK